MGFLKNLFGPRGEEAMRLDILMQYFVLNGFGSAALRWHDPMNGGEPIKAALVALLYGRILCIQKEARSELFARVDALAKENVRTKGAAGFEFQPWILQVGMGGGAQTLWPWEMKNPYLAKPKIYSAVLRVGRPTWMAPSDAFLDLTMAWGLERILAPSAALIAIAGFSRECQRETRHFLALFLSQMNQFWGSPDRIALGTDARAYAAAHQALHSGSLPDLSSESDPKKLRAVIERVWPIVVAYSEALGDVGTFRVPRPVSSLPFPKTAISDALLEWLTALSKPATIRTLRAHLPDLLEEVASAGAVGSLIVQYLMLCYFIPDRDAQIVAQLAAGDFAGLSEHEVERGSTISSSMMYDRAQREATLKQLGYPTSDQ
jgi:hypothetical protein